MRTVRNLVPRGVNINCTNKSGESGLYMAVKSGHKDLVVFLLSQPSLDVNSMIYGESALHIAAYNNRMEIVREILKRSDIRLDAKNRMGETARNVAQKYGYMEIVWMIMEKETEGRSASGVKAIGDFPAEAGVVRGRDEGKSDRSRSPMGIAAGSKSGGVDGSRDEVNREGKGKAG